MPEVRGIVTLQLVGDVDSAVAAMKRVVAYNQEHFGHRVRFEPSSMRTLDGSSG